MCIQGIVKTADDFFKVKVGQFKYVYCKLFWEKCVLPQ